MPSTTKFNCPRTCPQFNDRWCRFRPVLDVLGPIQVDSHTAKVQVEYTDPEALKCAVERMGGIWLGHGEYSLGDTEQKGYGFRLPMANGRTKIDGKGYWYHPLVLCDDGQLAYDEFGGVWGDVKQLPVLKAEYAMAAVETAAANQGWQSERTSEGLVVYHPQGGRLTYSNQGVLEAHEFVGTGCHDAMLQLGLNLTGLTAKPEYAMQKAQVMVGA